MRVNNIDNQTKLLNSLSELSMKKEVKVLYFYLFNQICQRADGELFEILGTYCQKVVLGDVEYVIYYLKIYPALSKEYANLLGSEFYFKNDGTSDLKYNFIDFKNMINKKLHDKSGSEKFLVSFCDEITLAIANME